MLNFYFRFPVVVDYIVGVLVAFVVWFLLSHDYLSAPKADRLFATVSDMSTISLTMAGFILTLTTVLISFKSTNKTDRNNVLETDRVFDLFFVSKLYFDTVQILNNSIKSLSVIALTGYAIKLTISELFLSPLFLYCVLGIVVITLTVIRCVIILTTIVKMQEEKQAGP